MCNSNNNRRNKYDDEPIHFCTNCLSLKIKEIGDNTNFYACLDCGCTEIEEDDLDEWIRLYNVKYGKPFLNLSETEEDEDEFFEDDPTFEDLY